MEPSRMYPRRQFVGWGAGFADLSEQAGPGVNRVINLREQEP